MEIYSKGVLKNRLRATLRFASLLLHSDNRMWLRLMSPPKSFAIAQDFIYPPNVIRHLPYGYVLFHLEGV